MVKMSNIRNQTQAILIDADIIIHFEKAGAILLLQKIYPKNPKLILDKVLTELSVRRSARVFADNLINFKICTLVPLAGNNEILKEYAHLIKTFGKGESACMAYCKYNKDILASSNLKDVKTYCLDNGIELLTTMDFLHEAFRSGIMSEAECDLFIYNVTTKGSKLPYKTIAEYLAKL
jgi:predicted nucleic acid-binding protein